LLEEGTIEEHASAVGVSGEELRLDKSFDSGAGVGRASDAEERDRFSGLGRATCG
jgi:hypothetical protein